MIRVRGTLKQSMASEVDDSVLLEVGGLSEREINDLLRECRVGTALTVADDAGAREVQPPSFLQAQLRELEEMFNKQRGELVEARRLAALNRGNGPEVKKLRDRLRQVEAQLQNERSAFKMTATRLANDVLAARMGATMPDVALDQWAALLGVAPVVERGPTKGDLVRPRGGNVVIGTVLSRTPDPRGCVEVLRKEDGRVQSIYAQDLEVVPEVSVSLARRLLTKAPAPPPVPPPPKPEDPRFGGLDITEEDS